MGLAVRARWLPAASCNNDLVEVEETLQLCLEEGSGIFGPWASLGGASSSGGLRDACRSWESGGVLCHGPLGPPICHVHFCAKD